jgi:hypothetical protein
MIPFITALAIVWMLGSAPAAPQDPAAQKTSEQVFKNIQVMKDVPVDDFLGSMGIMCAALGFDCSDCHTGAGTEKVDWAADTPEKMRARTMVQMMQSINRDNFAGRQMVTCWSCHHGRDHPATTPTLEYQYGPATQEMDDVLTQMPGQPAATHRVLSAVFHRSVRAKPGNCLRMLPISGSNLSNPIAGLPTGRRGL